LVFCGTGGVLLSVQHQDLVASERLAAAAQRYTSKIGAVVEGVTVAPIKVDFDALRAANPDVVGWIYCEGTIINYPVVQGKSNDEYLYHDYLGDYSVRGSIFVEAENRPGFTDAETIIYGHHMSSGTMFAALENWADQEFYDEHPVMWLLTPTQDYQIVLVSGHHSSARSDIYNVRHDHDKAFEQYLTDMKAQSEFVPSQDVVYSPDQNYVMLSTCSFIFEDARFVLHGVLVPVA
ncbi:MAG: class B sortase, partial [Atopobiaceae bacterium]|nr:class B sortase [Atopobiaceae bacterium]